MPPKPVLCDMCGGKFFKSSIAIHQKQCAAKKIAQTVFCPVCELPVNNDEYAGHLEACKDANAGKKKKRPAKNAAPQRLPEKYYARAAGIDDSKKTELEKEQARLELFGRIGKPCEACSVAAATLVCCMCNCVLCALCSDEIHDEDGALSFHKVERGEMTASSVATALEATDGRVPCAVCGRKFKNDRIAKHQVVCAKAATRKPRKQFPSAEEMRLRGTDFLEYKDCRTEVAWVSRWREEHERMLSITRTNEEEDAAAAAAAGTGAGAGAGAGVGAGAGAGFKPRAGAGAGVGAGIGAGADDDSPRMGQWVASESEHSGAGAALYAALEAADAAAAAVAATVASSGTASTTHAEGGARAGAGGEVGEGDDGADGGDGGDGGEGKKKKKEKRPKLHTGDPIVLDNGNVGWLRYKGPVFGLPKGVWYGIEYEQALGKHDGQFQDFHYFRCEMMHGAFVRPDRVSLRAGVEPPPVVLVAPPPPGKGSRAAAAEPAAPTADKGRAAPSTSTPSSSTPASSTAAAAAAAPARGGDRDRERARDKRSPRDRRERDKAERSERGAGAAPVAASAGAAAGSGAAPSRSRTKADPSTSPRGAGGSSTAAAAPAPVGGRGASTSTSAEVLAAQNRDTGSFVRKLRSTVSSAPTEGVWKEAGGVGDADKRNAVSGSGTRAARQLATEVHDSHDRPRLQKENEGAGKPVMGAKGRPPSGSTKKGKHPAMAVEEARKHDIDRSVRFLQRLHDVEGGPVNPQSAHAAAVAHIKSLESGKKLGAPDPLMGSLQSKKADPGAVRDKRAAYFNRLFAAEVSDTADE